MKRRDIPIVIYTDSQYVKRGITEWLRGWRANNWQQAKKRKIKNLDLWQVLASMQDNFTISWQWVRGHSGEMGNEKADALAHGAAQQQRDGGVVDVIEANTF